jgi:hypothetical protein
MNILHNIDDVRAEVMALEYAEYFDQSAWDRVLGALVDRPCALADAMRRMDTASRNQPVWVPIIVSAETVEVMA